MSRWSPTTAPPTARAIAASRFTSPSSNRVRRQDRLGAESAILGVVACGPVPAHILPLSASIFGNKIGNFRTYSRIFYGAAPIRGGLAASPCGSNEKEPQTLAGAALPEPSTARCGRLAMICPVYFTPRPAPVAASTMFIEVLPATTPAGIMPVLPWKPLIA